MLRTCCLSGRALYKLAITAVLTCCSLVSGFCAGVTSLAVAMDERVLQVFTSENHVGIASDAVGLRFTGPITESLASDLSTILFDAPGRFNHVVLELDSEGGDLAFARKAAEVLEIAGRTRELTTRVMGGATCASACVLLFMKGQKRKASGASVWVFHGACGRNTNVPSLSATQQFIDLLVASGVNKDFTCSLVEQGYVTRPGQFMISGFELFHHTDSNIITELLPSWQPEEPYGLWSILPR